MGYKSKFSGAEVEEKLENNVVYTFYFLMKDTPLNEDFIREMESQNQNGSYDEAIRILRGMIEDNNKILELVKHKYINVSINIGYALSVVYGALGASPDQVGVTSLTFPAIAEYIYQNGVGITNIISIPQNDGLIESIGSMRYIYTRREENGEVSEEFLYLSPDDAMYYVPSSPGGTISESMRERNKKVLKYERYFDSHGIWTSNYDKCFIISKSLTGYGMDLYYMNNGKILKAALYKETGNVEVTVFYDFNNN